jgi:hypothetical protein
MKILAVVGAGFIGFLFRYLNNVNASWKEI